MERKMEIIIIPLIYVKLKGGEEVEEEREEKGKEEGDEVMREKKMDEMWR